MANDLNSCHFIGRLGRDVELRSTASGVSVATFSLAVGKKYKNEESTTWLECKVFNKLADVCAQYLGKGKQVCITAEYTVDTWENAEGKRQYKSVFIVRDMQMLGGGERAESQPASRPTGGNPRLNPSKDDDDIPF